MCPEGVEPAWRLINDSKNTVGYEMNGGVVESEELMFAV